MIGCIKNINNLEIKDKDIKDINDKLIKAVEDGNANKIIELLGNGADINYKNSCGRTALMEASRLGYTKIVKLLINNGASINDKYVYYAVAEASHYRHMEVVKLLIDNGANISDIVKKDTLTALVVASTCGYIEILRSLINSGVDVCMRENDYRERFTLLTIASFYGHEEIVELLIAKGANVNGKDKYRETALMAAASNGHKEVVRMLIERGANINDIDNNGDTALMYASYEGHTEKVRLLVNNGANVNYKTTKRIEAYKINKGSTILMLASKNGHKEVVNILINNGANINDIDNNRSTALMYASKRGNVEVVELLIAKGANVNDIDGQGKTALMYASKRGNVEVVRLLVNNGADANYKTEHLGYDGNTALMLASNKGYIDKRYEEVVKILVDAGADINYKNKDWMTALSYASRCIERGINVVKLLLENGANIDGFSSKHKIIKIVKKMLIDNIKNCNIEKSLFLIYKYNNKIDYNMKDKEGNTFLHYASLINNASLFDIFLSNKVDINAVNNRGETPLYYALAKDNFDEGFIWYLLNKGCILKPSSCIKDKALVNVLLPYKGLCNNLVYEPLTIKLVGNANINYEKKCKIKEIINILAIKDEDFEKEKNMISFISNVMLNKAFEIDLSKININDSNDNNEDVELNIEVFDEIFNYFKEEDYWLSIKQKGINEVKRSFKEKLEIIKGYKPVNKPLLQMNSDERLKNTNFQRKKKLAKLLRLISKTAENGYNVDKITFVVNQILDVIVCSEGSLAAINDSIEYLVAEEINNTKGATEDLTKYIIGEELMHLRHDILKGVCRDKIRIIVDGIEETAEMTPHIFPQLVKEMSQELKLKVEYLDDIDYNLRYNKNEIVGLVLKNYKEKMIEYIKEKIEQNEVLWNKITNYVEREIFKSRSVLQIDDFLYKEIEEAGKYKYKIKEEVIKALFFHFNFIK